MTKKRWILLLSAVASVIILGVAALVGYFGLQRYRAGQTVAKARTAAEAGNLNAARQFYQEYLYEHDSDTAALEEYIQVCEQILPDRRRALLAAGRAYKKLAQNEPDSAERKTAVLDFYRQHRFWAELEHVISLFYGTDVQALDDELVYQKAVAAQEQSRRADAIAAFEEYLGLDTTPSDAASLKDVPLRLARSYAQDERPEKGIELFERLKEIYPDAPAIPVQYTEYLLDRSDEEAAAEQLAAVPEESRSDFDYLVAASRLANLTSDYTAAVTYAEQALALDPENINAHLNYLLSLDRSGRREAALAHIEELDPLFRADTPGFLMFLIEMNLNQREFDSATEALDTFATAYPDQSALEEYWRGRILLARGEDTGDTAIKKEARDRLAMATRMNPGLDRASYFLAIAELGLGNQQAAQVPLEDYLRTNPEDDQARRLWSQYFDTKKSLLELRFAANRLLENAAPDLNSLFYAIQDLSTQHEGEDTELLRQLMEKAIALAPSDHRGYRALAAHYLELDDVKKAEQVMKRAEAAGIARDAFPLLNSSMLLARGDADAALEMAKASLQSSTFDEAKAWAVVFAQRGHYKKADELLATYGQTQPEDLKEILLNVRLTLALRFGTIEQARACLADAETALADASGAEETLNNMRLSLAQALLTSPGAGDGRIDEARELVERVRAIAPSEPGLTVVEARLALENTLPDFARAQKLAESIPPTSDAYDAALLLLAEMAAKQGKHEAVLEWTGRALERAGRNTAALHLQGQAQLDMQMPGEARATLERLLEINSDDTRALYMLIRLYTELQLPDLAAPLLARYEAIAAQRPQFAEGLEELRAYASNSGADSGQSAEELRAELSEDPDDYAVVARLVHVLIAGDKHEDAIATLKTYLERNPNAAEPWVLMGQAILDQGGTADLAEASTAFTRAQIIVPEYRPAQLGLVEVQTRLNNVAFAISLCRRYLESRSNDVEILFRLASLLSRDPANHQEGLATIDRAIKQSERPDFFRLRAFLNIGLKRYDDAVRDLELLETLVGGTTPDDDLSLAEAYLGKSDLAAARASLTEARGKISGDSPRLQARVQRIETLLSTPGASS